jgi:hypothetical protein
MAGNLLREARATNGPGRAGPGGGEPRAGRAGATTDVTATGCAP